MLAGAEWDVALLQECPPRFAGAAGAGLRRRGAPGAHLAQLARRPARARRPPQPRPDRLRRGRLEPDPGPRRRARSAGSSSGASWRSTTGGRSGGRWPSPAPPPALCVANLHATNDRPELATEDVLRAAEAASEWAGDAPLLFGGDLNLRPGESPGVFDELRERFGLAAPTGPRRDRPPARPRAWRSSSRPRPWPPERRELRAGRPGPAPLRPRPGRGTFRNPPQGSEIVTASCISRIATVMQISQSRTPRSETGGN